MVPTLIHEYPKRPKAKIIDNSLANGYWVYIKRILSLDSELILCSDAAVFYRFIVFLRKMQNWTSRQLGVTTHLLLHVQICLQQMS